MILVGNVTGERPDSNDGNGIVGGADVGQAHKGGNAQFSSPFAFDMPGKLMQDVVYPSVEAYEFEHASCH